MAQRTTRHTVETGYISNFENIQYKKLWPKKLLRIREATFVFVLPCTHVAKILYGATLLSIKT